MNVPDLIKKFIFEVTGSKIGTDSQAVNSLKEYFKNNNVDIYVDDLDILVSMASEYSGKFVDIKGIQQDCVIRDYSGEVVSSYEKEFLSSGGGRLVKSDKSISPGKRKSHYKRFSEFMDKVGSELPFLSIRLKNRSVVVVKDNEAIVFFDGLSEKDGKIYGYVRFGKNVNSEEVISKFPLAFKKRKIINYVPSLGSYKIFPVLMDDFFNIVFNFMKWN